MTKNSCKTCDYVPKSEDDWTAKESLKNHVNNVHLNIKRFYCDLCDYACYFNYDLKKHKKFHEGNPFFKTKKCMRKDPSYKGQKQCSICGKNLYQPSHLQHHIKAVHEKIKRYQCDICKFKYYYISSFKRHYEGQHGKTLCEDLTKYAMDSTKHATGSTKHAVDSTKHTTDSTKHAIVSTKYPLETTKQAIDSTKCAIDSTKTDIIIKDVSNQEKETQCKFCGKDFSPRPFALPHHVKAVHENIKRFYCDICNFGFYHLHNLKRHYKGVHAKKISGDITKYSRTSAKEKIYYTLPRPKRGKWIVVLERI